jgi:hypothetical protein
MLIAFGNIAIRNFQPLAHSGGAFRQRQAEIVF